MGIDTDVILDRINTSDEMHKAHLDRIVSRIEGVEKRQDGIEDRLDDLEQIKDLAEGRASVFERIRSGGFKVLIVILGAFVAGYFSATPELRVDALIPKEKDFETPIEGPPRGDNDDEDQSD